MHSKKASGSFILIALVIFLSVWWLVNVSSRECNTNNDCSSESYCGSDFTCRTYPNIQKTVVQYSLLWPSVIIALALIITTLILRWDKLMPKKEEITIHHVEKETEEKPYYEKEYYHSQNPKSP